MALALRRLQCRWPCCIAAAGIGGAALSIATGQAVWRSRPFDEAQLTDRAGFGSELSQQLIQRLRSGLESEATARDSQIAGVVSSVQAEAQDLHQHPIAHPPAGSPNMSAGKSLDAHNPIRRSRI